MWFAFAAYLAGYASIFWLSKSPYALVALPLFWWVAHRVDRLAMYRYDGGRTKI